MDVSAKRSAAEFDTNVIARSDDRADVDREDRKDREDKEDRKLCCFHRAFMSSMSSLSTLF
jgi:hypothetical protein